MKRNRGWTQLFFIALIVFSLSCVYPQSGCATPPENVQLAYNLNSQTLSVIITHDTMLKGSHYIKFIEIKKNGAIMSINTYDSQPTGKTFTYYYKIPAIEEDTMQIVVTCNMWGKKISSLLTVMP